MKDAMKKILVMFLSALCLFSCVVVQAEEPEDLSAAYFDMVLSGLFDNYKFEADKEGMLRAIAAKALTENPELLEDFIDIASDYLDEHTMYYTPQEVDAFLEAFHAEYVGIGITVQRRVGAVTITSVFPESTAQKAGLMAEDKIMAVNGYDVRDYSVGELSALIRGAAGTEVKITVLRGETYKDFFVLRGTVNASTVSYQELEEGIGYLQITSFNNSTPTDILLADNFFREKKIQKLIIDLRDNPGGDLISVVTSLGFFVPKGKNVVSVEYSDPDRNRTLRSVGSLTAPYYKNLVVLINENSASGAELFAGNIRDHQLGVLVGITSYGKGTVQEFLNLPPLYDKVFGQIKLTTAEYILPGGEHVNGKGIKPDYHEANRVVRFKEEGLEPLDFLKDYKEGDSGKGVLAIKQRFKVLGMYVGEVDETFDTELSAVVRQFQRSMKLADTGLMDYETMRRFAAVMEQTKLTYDDQFDKAMEIIRQEKK